MKTQINKEEMRKEWIIEKWYEKVAYVVGVFFSIYMVFMFCMGFMFGFMGAF